MSMEGNYIAELILSCHAMQCRELTGALKVPLAC